VEGISDPNDEKWVKEDLTKPRATAETASHVQMEEAINDETAPADEISESKTADETTAGDAESGNEASTLNMIPVIILLKRIHLLIIAM
jgi:exodeoxyribonuclease VIII